jgi:UDPglucose 6-dehydrogenase
VSEDVTQHAVTGPEIEHTTPMTAPRIAVIGLGHIGLPTALGFAELGWTVVGADDNRQKAEQIARGEVPFYEPQVGELLQRHLASGRFSVAPSVQESIRRGTVLFVCVGTPQRKDGSADLSQIEAVARTIARDLDGYKLIVEKSTSPVRTADQIKRTIRRYCNGSDNGDHEFDVAVNPEFLSEGSACRDLFNPDRIILGVESDRARDLLLRIYRPLLDRSTGGKVVVTNLTTAELIKHASNAFLATKISFINMIADMCEAARANVSEVALGLGLDPRIGAAFLGAGVGFGGYCLPKDLRALIRIGEDLGADVRLLRAVEALNQQRIDRLIRKLEQTMWVLRGKTVGLLGLAFKPGTDDVREAPSLRVVDRLLKEDVCLRLHDPQAVENMRRALPEDPPRLIYCASPYDAARGAHALVVLTEWEEYRTLDLRRVVGLMETPCIVDGRNMFDPSTVRGLGFEYASVGRP